MGPGIVGAATVQPGKDTWSQLFPNVTTGLDSYAPNEDGSFDGIDDFHGGSSDVALFTLAPGSPSLIDFDAALASDGLPDLTPSDVFITDFDGTFGLFANNDSLGLLPTDSIVGLDIQAVPEPATLALLAIGMFGMALSAARGRVRSRQRAD